MVGFKKITRLVRKNKIYMPEEEELDEAGFSPDLDEEIDPNEALDLDMGHEDEEDPMI